MCSLISALNIRKPVENLQYLFTTKFLIQICPVILNPVIIVLFNLNYRLIELNNEFEFDSYKFFGFKYCNDAVMFSSISSQTGWIIYLADKIYFSNIFFSLIENKNKK